MQKPITKEDVKNDNYIPVHTSLAPSYGSEAKLAAHIKVMDDGLKVLMATSLQIVAALPKQNLEWDTLLRAFANNPCARAMGDPASINRKFEAHSEHLFKFNGDPDPALVNQVVTWWESQAVADPDIRADTKIDIKDLAKIVAWSGATITDFGTVFYKREYHEKTVIDIGVLRFPDMDKPYFKLYRLRVHAWSDCTRTLAYQSDTNGITSTLDWQCFEPRSEYIKDLKQEAKDKANDFVDDLFNDD